VSFQWLACDSGDSNCDPVPGATGQNYKLTDADADVGKRFCVKVTGTNAGGGVTVDCSGVTNEIFPETATQLTPAKLTGSAYVGDTLVSDVGTWKYPGTTWTRQWEQCDADGTGCSTISGAKSATYVIKADDLGHKLRVRIGADSNGANKFPAGIEVFTNLSGVVTDPPPPPADPTPQGGGGGGGGNAGAGGGGGGNPSPDVTAPVLQSLGAVSSKLTPGAQLKLKVGVTEGGTLSVELQRVRAGRKVGKKCKAGAKKGRKCTVISKIAIVNTGVGGSGIVALPKRKLAAGDYRAVVTPIDAAGNRGAAKTISFKVTEK
jgi:DNA-binding cell septation regulator SpoVG